MRELGVAADALTRIASVMEAREARLVKQEADRDRMLHRMEAAFAMMFERQFGPGTLGDEGPVS